MVPWRLIFFGVNLAASVGWIVFCALFVTEESFVSNLAAVVTFFAIASPGFGVAVAEWVLLVRPKAALERRLGVLAGLVGALALFALVANAGEALVKGGSPGALFWLGFGSACLAIAAYGFWCCWLRVRRQTLPQSRGFPVGQTAAP